MKLKSLLIENETESLIHIKNLIAHIDPDLETSGEVASIKEADEYLQNNKVDLIFLKMQLPDGSGFDLLNRLEHPLPGLIALTQNDPLSVNVLKFAALNYVTFPLNEIIFGKLLNQVLSQLKANALKPTHTKNIAKMALPSLTGMDFIDIEEILRCEADNNYTTIFFKDNRKTVISKPLHYFESELQPHNFLRVHHKHLINLKMIKSYSKGKGGGFIVLGNNQTIPVSVRKKSHLMEVFTV